MVVCRFDGPRRAQLRGRSSWHLARAALAAGLVVTSALATLVALLSLGVLLAPTVVAAAIALVVTILAGLIDTPLAYRELSGVRTSNRSGPTEARRAQLALWVPLKMSPTRPSSSLQMNPLASRGRCCRLTGAYMYG
jgi:hypothetical protein